MRDGDRHLGGAARYVGSVHRHENVQRAAFGLPQMDALTDGDGERPFEGRGDTRDVRRKRAIGGGVCDAHEQEVVALLRLLGDGLLAGRVEPANGHVDRAGLIFADLALLAFLGGRLDAFPGAIVFPGVFLFLLLATALGLVLAGLGQRQDRRGQAARAGDQSGEPRGKLSVRALIHREQHALEVRDELFRLEFLALKPFLFRLAHRYARQRPA